MTEQLEEINPSEEELEPAEFGKMSSNAVVEDVAEENAENDDDEEEAVSEETSGESPIKGAWKQVESFGQALGTALQGRGNVVMVRVNDEALQHLDMLVEADITKSRSESAAFLINEGIKTNQQLYSQIEKITNQITDLRQQLREMIKSEEPDEEEEKEE